MIFLRKRREEIEYEIYDALNITDYAYTLGDWENSDLETTTEEETTESTSATVDWSGTVKFENNEDVTEVNRKRAEADPKTGLQGIDVLPVRKANLNF